MDGWLDGPRRRLRGSSLESGVNATAMPRVVARHEAMATKLSSKFFTTGIVVSIDFLLLD